MSWVDSVVDSSEGRTSNMLQPNKIHAFILCFAVPVVVADHVKAHVRFVREFALL